MSSSIEMNGGQLAERRTRFAVCEFDSHRRPCRSCIFRNWSRLSLRKFTHSQDTLIVYLDHTVRFDVTCVYMSVYDVICVFTVTILCVLTSHVCICLEQRSDFPF